MPRNTPSTSSSCAAASCSCWSTRIAKARPAAPGPGGQPPADTASSLDRLLNAWGVEAPSDKVVLDLRGAWRVRAGAQDRVQAVDYVAWYNLQGDSLNHDDVALAQLDQITVASAGEVRKREGARWSSPRC